MPSQLQRKPVNTYHHGDLREALVRAALAEAERGGPEAISIKALAKNSVSRSPRHTGILPTARRCCRP